MDLTASFFVLGDGTEIRRAAHGRLVAVVDGCTDPEATQSNNDYYEEPIESGQPFTKHYLQENQIDHCLSSLQFHQINHTNKLAGPLAQ